MVGSRNRVIIMGLLMGLLVAFAGHAFAAKGGNGGGKRGGSNTGGSGGLSLVLLNGDSAPHHGGQVTFTVSTTVTDRPYVQLDCYQGALVYSASAGFFPDYPWPWDQIMTLSSNAWTSGAAACTATLFYWDGSRTRDLGSLSFDAAA